MIDKIRFTITLALLVAVNLPIKGQVNERDTALVNRSKEQDLQITLLTCTSGGEIYSAYGHSAVRVRDVGRDIDMVFNYGTFDFSTPYFVPKFLCGTLDYMLSATSYWRFVGSYKWEKRGVVERELILSRSQREAVEEFLIRNIQPENRFYRYDFFFDNCATRIRDVVFRCAGVKGGECMVKGEETFRDCLHEYVGPDKWYGAGIDLILGVRADRHVSAYDKAMLPDYLEKLLDEEGLLGDPQVLLERGEFEEDGAWSVTPGMVAWGVFVLTLCIVVYEVKGGKWCKWYDYVMYVVMMVLALLFWFLWVVSEIKITSYNYNVLWASVLYVPMIWALAARKWRALRGMAWVNVGMIVAYMVIVVFGVQHAPSLALAAAGSMALRNGMAIYRGRA